jgi:hypothetical protein
VCACSPPPALRAAPVRCPPSPLFSRSCHAWCSTWLLLGDGKGTEHALSKAARGVLSVYRGGVCGAAVRPVMGDLRELSSEREELDAPSVLLLNASLLLPVLARARTDPSFATHVMGVLVAHSTRADAPASFSPQAPFPQVGGARCWAHT